MNQPMTLMIHCINDPNEQLSFQQELVFRKRVEKSNYKVTNHQYQTFPSINAQTFNFKMGLLGHSGGQSNLLSRFKSNTYDERMQPTLGGRYDRLILKNQSDSVELQIWDYNSAEWFLRTSRLFMQQMNHCAFFVYRIDDMQTFECLKEINKLFDQNGHPNAIKVLVGNCSDCEENRKVSEAEAQKFLQSINGAFYIEVSAKTGDNVNYLFGKTIELLKDKFKNQKSIQQQVKPNGESNPEKKKKWWKFNQ